MTVLFSLFTLVLCARFCFAITLSELSGCWENTTTGTPPYIEIEFNLTGPGASTFSSFTQYSVVNATYASPFTREVDSTSFNPTAATLTVVSSLMIGGLIGGGGPSTIMFTFAFSNVTFDRLRGTFTVTAAQKMDMRRPARPVGCKSPLPIRITDSPTPRPTPPTPFPTPPTTAMPTPPLPTPLPSTAVIVPAPSPSLPMISETSSTTTTTTNGGTTTPLGQSSNGAGLPIASETAVAPGDEPLSGSTIGLVVGGIGLLVIGGAAIVYVLAKRRREQRQKQKNAASDEPPPASAAKPKSSAGAELKDRTYSSVSLVKSFVTGGDSVSSGDTGTIDIGGTTATSASASNYSDMPMRPKPDVANRPAAPLPPDAV